MSEVQQAVIEAHLRTLKLPAIRREYPQLARQAQAASWPYEDYLRELLELEVRAREQHVAAHRLHEARFPDIKTLEQIDWQQMQGVSKHKILELAACEYLGKAEDLIIAGPIGTGKTHLISVNYFSRRIASAETLLGRDCCLT